MLYEYTENFIFSSNQVESGWDKSCKRWVLKWLKLSQEINSVLKSLKLLDYQVQVQTVLQNKNIITTYRFLSDDWKVACKKEARSSHYNISIVKTQIL